MMLSVCVCVCSVHSKTSTLFSIEKATRVAWAAAVVSSALVPASNSKSTTCTAYMEMCVCVRACEYERKYKFQIASKLCLIFRI